MDDTEKMKIAERAFELFRLLVAHVEVCDRKEAHDGKVIGKRFANLKQEKEAHDQLQKKYILPLIAKCTWTKFKYSDLREIIPPAFETDSVQRHEFLDDLRWWSKKEFGEYDIPF